MSSNFPIHMEAAKSTKLFKKFIENKNKSALVTGPIIQNIEFGNPSLKQNEETFTYQSHNKKQQFQQKLDTEKLKNPIENNKLNEIYRSTEKNKSPYVQADNFMQRNTQIQSKTKHSPIHEQNQQTIQKEFRTGLITEQYHNKILNKYNRLFSEHSQLKDKAINQRKQTIKMQSQIDILNKKIFQFRNKEDQLILENKKIKQKTILQAKTIKQLQQSNRQLNYRVQEMKDMANGQEHSSKKHENDTLHWKKFNEELKQKIRQLESEIVKLKDQNNVLERQKLIACKETSNKEAHLNEMRDKINQLITDNSSLKDEIFHITSKLYHFQQENKVLKADVRRNSQQFPLSYLQEHLKQVPRGHTRSQYIAHENFEEKGTQGSKNQQKPQRTQRTQRRRGQFARQRGMKKVDNQVQNKPANKQIQTSINQSSPNNKIASSMKKHQQLCMELQKIKDSKTINGSMRRQKITIERQLQEIEEFLKKQNQQ